MRNELRDIFKRLLDNPVTLALLDELGVEEAEDLREVTRAYGYGWFMLTVW